MFTLVDNSTVLIQLHYIKLDLNFVILILFSVCYSLVPYYNYFYKIELSNKIDLYYYSYKFLK